MALTESTMMALGSPAAGFSLLGTDGKQYTLASFQQPVLVVLFICNHCPYVIHIAPALAKLSARYQSQGVDFVAINSNDSAAYPADSYDKMQLEHTKRGYVFPYLYDESQEVAKAYNAACTPDIYVFGQERTLVYRGQFDNTRPHRIASGHYDDRDGEANGESLATVLDVILAGKPVEGIQYPSLGCNIKWKKGSEPHWAG